MTDPADIAAAALESIGTDWYDQAECQGMTHVMYDAARVAEAKAICRRCPVRFQCDVTAEARDERHGVWAGKDRSLPVERRTTGGFAA